MKTAEITCYVCLHKRYHMILPVLTAIFTTNPHSEACEIERATNAEEAKCEGIASAEGTREKMNIFDKYA